MEDLSTIHELPPENRSKTAHKRKLRHGISWRWDSARTLVSIFVNNNAGLMLVGASQFFLSAMNVAVKLLNSLDKPVPTLELIWVRMVITYICSIAYMYWKQIPDPVFGPKGLRLLLVLRGFTGFFGLSGLYFSLQYLSLSDAMVLSFLSPILIGFTGAMFLKEPFSLKEMFAGLCSFLGVVLIARPQFLFSKLHANRSAGIPADLFEVATPEQRMLSVIAALIGVLGATGAYTSLRAIGKRAHTLHSITFFSTQCVLASTAGMMIFKVTPVIPTHVSWLVKYVPLDTFLRSMSTQILLTMGLQRETAARGSLANYIGVVFALAFERIVFHTTPSELSIAGSVIIMSSAIYVAVPPSIYFY
ncbi:drug/metabolite transporter superfamily [Lactarius pseudohatsudake]|nr:drug/metabolite transporter superfamily [Lactarius pseudohatsudake]